MRNIYLVAIFLFILMIHIWGQYTGNEWLEKLTKPLLIPVLAGYFLWSTKSFASGLKKWIAGALFFSWAGDLLLMFVSSDSDFFLAGLAAFLVAHICYILFFHVIRVQGKIKGKLFLLLLVFIYYVGLMTILSPWLGSFKLPVRIYGVVICFMLMLAMHMLYIKNKKAGWDMFSGALLFILSDSVLAVNKFYIPFAEAGVIVMLTYGFAQLLIVRGAVHYITTSEQKI
jgi:uncharacterized membrane protein YhhN